MGADRVAVVAGVGIVAFSAVFTYATFTPLHVPWYSPLDGQWRIALGEPALFAMDWYGRVAYALAAALLACTATMLATRVVPPGSDLVVWSVTGNVLLFLVLCSALFVFTLARRDIEAPPPWPPSIEQTRPGPSA